MVRFGYFLMFSFGLLAVSVCTGQPIKPLHYRSEADSYGLASG